MKCTFGFALPDEWTNRFGAKWLHDASASAPLVARHHGSKLIARLLTGFLRLCTFTSNAQSTIMILFLFRMQIGCNIPIN